MNVRNLDIEQSNDIKYDFKIQIPLFLFSLKVNLDVEHMDFTFLSLKQCSISRIHFLIYFSTKENLEIDYHDSTFLFFFFLSLSLHCNFSLLVI